MRSTCVVIQLVLALALSAPGAVANAETSDVKQIDPDVAYVSSGGMWTEGERYGSYRIVVIREGVEHTATSAFAQWLWFDESKSQQVVIASEPIAELRRDLSNLIVNVTFDYRVKEDGNFNLDLRDRVSGNPRTVRLRLGKPGEARLSE